MKKRLFLWGSFDLFGCVVSFYYSFYHPDYKYRNFQTGVNRKSGYFLKKEKTFSVTIRSSFMKTNDAQRQTCKCCGHLDYYEFYVPDEIWAMVVPPEYVGKVLCLPCFDKFASEKDIDYSPFLKDFYFVGDQVSFIFHTASHAFRKEGN